MLAYSAIKEWGGSHVYLQDGFLVVAALCANSHVSTRDKLATVKKSYCQKRKESSAECDMLSQLQL